MITLGFWVQILLFEYQVDLEGLMLVGLELMKPWHVFFFSCNRNLIRTCKFQALWILL